MIPVFFDIGLPRSDGLLPEKGWDAVHDAVGVNSERVEILISNKVLSIWVLMLDDCA